MICIKVLNTVATHPTNTTKQTNKNSPSPYFQIKNPKTPVTLTHATPIIIFLLRLFLSSSIVYGSGLPYLDAKLSIARLFTGCVDERCAEERAVEVRAVDFVALDDVRAVEPE